MSFNGFGTEFGPMALIVRYYQYTCMKFNAVYDKGVMEIFSINCTLSYLEEITQILMSRIAGHSIPCLFLWLMLIFSLIIIVSAQSAQAVRHLRK